MIMAQVTELMTTLHVRAVAEAVGVCVFAHVRACIRVRVCVCTVASRSGWSG